MKITKRTRNRWTPDGRLETVVTTTASHSVVTPKNWGEATFLIRGTGTLVLHRFSSKLKQMFMGDHCLGRKGAVA